MKSLDDAVLADYLHSHPFRTVVGDIAFGSDGKWRERRSVWVQYHDIKGFELEEFGGPDPIRLSILSPDSYKNGAMIYPYAEARGTPTSMK